jgi:DNA-directed RNA polymerase specialized sigma24 family protein
MSRRKSELAVRHLRLIAGVCHKSWRMLPIHVKLQLDLEDLISETVLAVVNTSAQYDRKRGAETTFVHRVAISHCVNVSVRYQQKKRITNGMVYLDELIPDRTSFRDWNKSIPTTTDWVETRSGMERILAAASEGLRDALSLFLEHRYKAPMQDSLLEELRGLVRSYRINREEFAAVLKVT